jgi:hypothetical protein
MSRFTSRTSRSMHGCPACMLCVAIASALLVALPAAQAAPGGGSGETRRFAAAYNKLPLAFEDVRGRGEAVDFVARRGGYALGLTATEAAFALRAAGSSTVAGLRMEIIGGNRSAVARGTQKLPGIVHQYVGDDPTKWHSDEMFAEVRYDSVYAGIDLVYHSADGRLEYDFVVAPGADPSRIALRFNGADHLRVAADGALTMAAGGGELRWAPPVAYQTIGGVRRPVAGRYRVSVDGSSKTRVAFVVGTYDHKRPLVIDPAVSYSTFLGGPEADRGNAIVVDSTGAAYVTGSASAGFPIGSVSVPPFQFMNAGGQDAFISKLDPTGTMLLYSTYVGGRNFDEGTGIALDLGGNIYVTGNTSSPDFPIQPFGAVLQRALGGNMDAFVLKLTNAGQLVYSTYLGGAGNDHAHGIAVDAINRPYIVGETESATTFPVSNPAYDPLYNLGPWDVFVTRLVPTYAALSYSTFLGGSGDDRGNGIVLDRYRAYVTGSTTSPNFPTTAGASLPTSGGADAFVTELAPDGLTLETSTCLGGIGNDYATAIARGSAGWIYITGFTDSADFPTVGPAQAALAGGTDAFITKFDPTLLSRTYSTYVGGPDNDRAYGIALSSAGGAWVTGYTESPGFPTIAPTQATYAGGFNDVFVLRLDPVGSAFNFSTFLGGPGSQTAQGIAVDSADSAYVVGATSDTSFPMTAPGFDRSFNGADDAFVVKYQN